MTPQLLQAIRLLQFSHVELAAFVQEELDRNPLLERAEEPGSPTTAPRRSTASTTPERRRDARRRGLARRPACDRRRRAGTRPRHRGRQCLRFGTPRRRRLDPRRSGPVRHRLVGRAGAGGRPDGEAPNLEAYVATRATLQDHLAAQLSHRLPRWRRPHDRPGHHRWHRRGRLLPRSAVRYRRTDSALAEARVERLLAPIQTFDPSRRRCARPRRMSRASSCASRTASTLRWRR